MANRFTDSEKWKKTWFRKLKPVEKCFWNYLTDSCNAAGVWIVDFEAAEFFIGDKLDIEGIKKTFQKQYIEFDKGEKWYLVDYIEFQCKCPIEELNPKNKFHASVLKLIDKFSLYKITGTTITKEEETEEIEQKENKEQRAERKEKTEELSEDSLEDSQSEGNIEITTSNNKQYKIKLNAVDYGKEDFSLQKEGASKGDVSPLDRSMEGVKEKVKEKEKAKLREKEKAKEEAKAKEREKEKKEKEMVSVKQPDFGRGNESQKNTNAVDFGKSFENIEYYEFMAMQNIPAGAMKAWRMWIESWVEKGEKITRIEAIAQLKQLREVSLDVDIGEVIKGALEARHKGFTFIIEKILRDKKNGQSGKQSNGNFRRFAKGATSMEEIEHGLDKAFGKNST